MIFLGNAYLSNLLGRPVVDASERTVGRLRDLVALAGEVYPPITKIVIRRGREQIVLPLSAVKIVTEDSVTLRADLAHLPRELIMADEFPLAQAILDRQVVDVDGRRVVRVNDLEVADLGGRLRLVAADVGTRGLLRRLGVEQLVSGLARLFGQEIRGKVIAWDHVHMVGPGAHPLQLALARDRLTTMRPADLADIAGQLSAAERAHLFLSLPDETAAEAMSELEPELQVAVLNDLPEEDAADIVEEMVPDEAADLLGDLPPEQARDILELMEPEEAAEVKALMQFAEDTAGGLMTTEWVEVPEHLTADAAIARLRELAPVAETIFYIYVVDADERLVGVLSLRDLILMPGEEAIASRVVRDAVRVHLNATAEDTAQLINKYGLLAVPVVDDAGKLRGIVTVDDVMDLVIPAVRRRRQLRR